MHTGIEMTLPMIALAALLTAVAAVGAAGAAKAAPFASHGPEFFEKLLADRAYVYALTYTRRPDAAVVAPRAGRHAVAP